jgi:hypothetical protein
MGRCRIKALGFAWRDDLRKVLMLGLASASLSAAVATSRLQPRLELHPDDWVPYEEGSLRRRFRSFSHFLYHLRELVSVQHPAAMVFLTLAINPAFRERIMLVTAYANECSW